MSETSMDDFPSVSNSDSNSNIKTYTFNEKVDDFPVHKPDINNLVISYLINEGYPKAAKAFAIEANVRVNLRDTALSERVLIRNAILGGHIEIAIDAINDAFPTILDTNPKLHFALLRLQLIELIRTRDMRKLDGILEVLDFTATHLSPRTTKYPEFAADLDRTMSLMVFSPDCIPKDIEPLLDTNLRLKIANEVNHTILKQSREFSGAHLQDLCRLRQYAEQQCRELNKAIPSSIDLGIGSEDFLSARMTQTGNSDVHADGSKEDTHMA